MRFLSSLLIFTVIFSIYADKEKVNFKHSIFEEEYNILVKLVNGEFLVPVKERTWVKKKLLLLNFGDQNQSPQSMRKHEAYFLKKGTEF